MRMPERRRAIGTDGFSISSLRLQRKSVDQEADERRSWMNEEFRWSSHQILMMSSLSSFLRFILARMVAAILDAKAPISRCLFSQITKRSSPRNRRQRLREGGISPDLAERSLPREELVRVEHLPRSDHHALFLLLLDGDRREEKGQEKRGIYRGAQAGGWWDGQIGHFRPRTRRTLAM